MPIIVQWENNEKTIMRTTFTTPWTWNALPAIRQQGLEMMAEVEHLVDSIVDFRTVEHIPKGSLSAWRSMRSSRTSQQGVTVIVGTLPTIRMLYHSYVTAFPSAREVYRLVYTLEEAHATLDKIRQARHSH